MKASELNRALALHDSGVQSVERSLDARVVRVRLDLGNYEQSWYRAGDPEIISGTLTFSDVSRLESKPDLASFTWVEDRFDGEIIEVKPLPSESPGEDGVELIIHTMDYSTRTRDILILRIFAGAVDWTADDPSA